MIVDRDKILAVLREQRDHIEHAYGLRMIGLVGSVARCEATLESDVDVLVDVVPARAPSMFKLFDAETELKEAIGAGLPVEFVFREAMRPSGRRLIERDLVPL